MTIERLDEFINRQGIKSAELCKIIDNIEQTIKKQAEQIKSHRECLDNVSFYLKKGLLGYAGKILDEELSKEFKDETK